MPDMIQLLPDAVANQIAAGEVIQRPASAVKELLENAIDAEATQIKLIIKDAGKTLIQVVDNGSGMTPADASLCFERHATSKIREASDLYSILTMGFRGEALSSIASISKVELKTRTADQEAGICILAESSGVLSKDECQCPVGTSISVKNLFYNTPARRNFLKSESVEKRHILSEFQRIALAHPEISMQLYQNGQLTHQLPSGNFKQRITSLFGNIYNQRLVPVEEKTELLGISGFVGKPEYAKKVRGEQFFFVNKRFIRSPYLNNAVEQAFAELIPDEAFPGFFLCLETNPEQIDVNIHPTKTEIRFQDERYVYQIVRAAVKRALGAYNVSPTLDFEQESAFSTLPPPKGKPIKPPSIEVNPDYNPFGRESRPASRPPGSLTSRINPDQWEKIFPHEGDVPLAGDSQQVEKLIQADWDKIKDDNGQKKFFQLHNKYILTPVKSGLMVIDQQRAHERVLFERFQQQLKSRTVSSQQLLFPENIRLSEHDATLMHEIIDEIRKIGFGIHALSDSTFVIESVPADMEEESGLQDIIEGIIENVQKNQLDLAGDMHTNVIRSTSKRLSVKHGRPLSEKEMVSLTDSLFACQMPHYSPGGKPVLYIISLDEFSTKFK